MFNKILIANRGEIAVRIIKTARRMGVATVAIYSDADVNALHVEMADEAVRVGPPPSAESYLKAEAIIKAALDTGAGAIHPGFGFLSENADFVKAVEASGLIFIGPGDEAIAAMGDKITSKLIAEKAGVSTVPGTKNAIEDIKEAADVAATIGYPVMVKASAGGGGKGMRVAYDEASLREAVPQARNEAAASFGDERVFIEKFIRHPRHIEIQILADNDGGIVYLGERECSLQRRHQKVFEEAPSPFINAKTRAAMGKQAVKLARAVNYRSAGTVEFIVGADQDFYFLEMNTRLQVEHPVTELIYGLDLVEWMIRIAGGEKLNFAQKDIKPNGWAMEARIYAEDPSRNFLPSIGTLKCYSEPPSDGEGVGVGIRVDSGVADGGEISMFYDPMIAKLISHGTTRTEAIDRLAAALDRYVIEGVRHNRQFLRHVCDNPCYRKGEMTTAFIGDEYPEGFTPAAPSGALRLHMLGLAVLIVAERTARLMAIGGGVPGAGAAEAAAVWHLFTGGDEVVAKVDLAPEKGAAMKGDSAPEKAAAVVEIEGTTLAFDRMPKLSLRLFDGIINGEAVAIQYRKEAEVVSLMAGADALEVLVLPARAAAAQALMPARGGGAMAGQITAPMPGLLARLLVGVGDKVAPGDDVAVIEAMKMENLLKADRGGVVAEIHAAEGDSLAVDQPILSFAASGDE